MSEPQRRRGRPRAQGPYPGIDLAGMRRLREQAEDLERAAQETRALLREAIAATASVSPLPNGAINAMIEASGYSHETVRRMRREGEEANAA